MFESGKIREILDEINEARHHVMNAKYCLFVAENLANRLKATTPTEDEHKLKLTHKINEAYEELKKIKILLWRIIEYGGGFL